MKSVVWPLLLASVLSARYEKPHIVVFMVDDLGWHDVGYQNAEFETRNIDRLAGEGLKLKNFYSQPLCTPSRVAFMTGQHPVEKGAQNAVFKRCSVAGLDPDDDPILSEWLQENGYKTHLVGKWHLGQATFDQTPVGQGFDEFFGFFGAFVEHFTHQYGFSSQMFCQNQMFDTDNQWGYDLWENIEGVGRDYDGEYSTLLYTNKAEDMIRDHAAREDNSMFLWVSYAAMHEPFQAPLQYINGRQCTHIGRDQYDFRRILCGMMQVLDESIGRIVRILDDVGYLDNTMIIFMSDNGAAAIGDMLAPGNEPSGSNYPLRGSKSTLFEGGVRVPAFIWPHPQRLSSLSPLHPLKESFELFHISDWFLTILDMAGVSNVESAQTTVKATNKSIVASYNQWPSMKSGTPSPRNEIFYNLAWPLDTHYGAARNREFKLHTGTRKTIVDGWFNAENPRQDRLICTTRTQPSCVDTLPDEMFWNIKEDPEEQNELNIDRLSAWEQYNYDELRELLSTWEGAVEPLQQEDERLEADGLPMYWRCHWSPWISTDDFPLHSESSCRYGPLDDAHCGKEMDAGDWLEYA